MKKFLLILMGIVVFGTCAFALDSDFKNSLLKVDLAKCGANDYNITLFTQKPYNEPIKVIKKTNTSYYILLPETFHSVGSVAAGGDIKNIEVKLFPYAGQDLNNGYTKITIYTTKPVNIIPKLSTSSGSVAPSIDAKKLAQLDSAFNSKQTQLQAKERQAQIEAQRKAQIEAQKAQEQKALEAKRLAQQEAQRKAQIEAQKAQELKAAQERQAKLAAQQEAQKKAQLEAQRKAQEQKQVQQQAVKTQPKTVQTQTNTPKPAAADIKPVQPKVEPAPKEQIVEKTNNEQAPVETSEPSQEEQILTEDLTEDLQANEQMEQIPDTNDTQITQASFIEILKDKLSPIKPYYYIIIDNPIIIIASLVAFIGIIMLVILNKNRKKGQNMQDNTPAYDDTNQEQPLEQQTSSEPETSDTSVNQTEEDEVQSFKDEFKELAYDNPDTQDNTESTVEETQQEEIEEIQTPVEPEEEPYVEPKVLSSIKVASDRGFLLVDRQGTKALFGFINEDVFFLYQFKEYISDYEIKFRIAEKQSDRIFFIVKVDKFKLLVKVTRTSMQLELEM